MKKKNKKKRRNVEKKWNETSTFHPPCRRSPLLFQYPWMAALSNIECQYLRASWPARLFHVENVFFFPLSSLFFFYGEKRNEGRSIIKIVRRVSRDPIKKVRRQHSPFCNWPWSAFIFACNRKCCASLSRISTGTVKIPAILLKYVQAVRSPRNLVSRPVRRPNSRSPCHGGCIAGTGRTKKYYCTSNITFNWKIRSKLKMYTISRVYLHFIFIFCNSFVDKFQF